MEKDPIERTGNGRVLFDLKPFGQTESYPRIRVGGTLERGEHQLALTYELTGDLGFILIPGPAPTPERRRRLWEETCLELFLGLKNEPGYWEFNFSPAGHWNVFRFEGYRNQDFGDQLVEADGFQILPFTVLREKNRFLLGVELGIENLGVKREPLDLGICSVVKTRSGDITYWALAHGPLKPDFHLRDGFQIQV